VLLLIGGEMSTRLYVRRPCCGSLPAFGER
jgi:hypothetical protein